MAPKPDCKQCLEAEGIELPDGTILKPDPSEHVVRFGGQWVCRKHFHIRNEKYIEGSDRPEFWTLQELMPNRATRREMTRRLRRGVRKTAQPSPEA